jgi:hypothetical protein
MPLVPVAVVNLLRAAITRLSGPALARFGSMATARLGVTVQGTAQQMAGQLTHYITHNPMSAGLTATALIASGASFNVSDFVKIWEEADGSVPEDLKYLLEQAGDIAEKRNSITGDQDEDTVMGMEVGDLRKAALVLAHTDNQVQILIDQFGDIDTVMAVRSALLSLDDTQLQLYKERNRA